MAKLKQIDHTGRAWICEGPPRREVWRAFKVHTEKWISLWSIMRSIHARSCWLPSIGSGIFEFKMGFTVCTNLFHDIAFECIWFACRHADQIAHDAAWCVLCVFVLTCGCRSKKLRFQSETKEVAIEYKQSLQDRLLAKIATSCNWETVFFW